MLMAANLVRSVAKLVARQPNGSLGSNPNISKTRVKGESKHFCTPRKKTCIRRLSKCLPLIIRYKRDSVTKWMLLFNPYIIIKDKCRVKSSDCFSDLE